MVLLYVLIVHKFWLLVSSSLVFCFSLVFFCFSLSRKMRITKKFDVLDRDSCFTIDDVTSFFIQEVEYRMR